MVPASFIFMANKLGTGMLERLRRAFSDITNDDRTDVLQSGVGTAPSYTDNVYKAVIPNFLYKPPFGYPMFKDIPEIKRMAKVPHVMMVTNTICNEIAGLDWDIYKHEDYEDVVPDEIVKKTKDWFLNPNRNDESFEMIMRTLVRDILEMDAGVIVKVRNLKDEFLEMYVRDGGTFTKNPDIYGIMPEERAYYQYGWLTGARPQDFDRNEIAYFMLNPRSDSIYGLSNVEVLMNTLQLLTYGIDANLEYFTDNNIPKGVLKMINANADDIKAFKQAWSEQMKTKDQAGKWRKQFHKMPIINTDGAFERIAFSNVELEFIQQQEWFVKLVWACYGVTPSELGFTDDSNRATDMVQSSVFKRKLIRPLTQLLEYNFNRNIVNDLPWIKGKFEDKVLFEFNKVDTQEDLNRRQIIWGDLEKGLRTVNECREDIEFEPIEGGDELKNKFSGSFEGFNPFNGGKDEDDGERFRQEFENEEDDVKLKKKSFDLKHKYKRRVRRGNKWVYFYDDIKPRTIGSGTGFEGSKEKLISKAMSYNASVKASDKAIIEKSKKALLNKKDSFSVNQVNGVWNFERKRIHNSIRKSYFKDAKLAVSKEPKIIFMAGLPGSGKTFSVSQYYEKVEGTKLFKDKKSGENFLVLNSDDIKKELPGFENGAGSMFVHEESSYLNKQLVRKFMDKKVNVIIDGTMKTKSSASKLLSKSKEKGYKSKLIYVDVSHDVSLDRAKARYERNGRYVPYNFIVGIGDKVDNTVAETRKDFDGFLHIDNNVKPVVIEREGI